MIELSTTIREIHVRYNGNSHTFSAEEAEVQEGSADDQILNAVEIALSEVSGEQVKLDNYEVERYETMCVVRPQAKFG